MISSSTTIETTDMVHSPLLPTENLQPTHPKAFERGPFLAAKSLLQTFSTTTRQRHPPPPPVSIPKHMHTHTHTKQKKNHIRFVTIGASSYCEKVRWGLDLLEADPESDVYYTEDAHPPVLASIATLEASEGEASMTPMVQYYEYECGDNKHGPQNQDSNNRKKKRILYDSTNILPIVCPFLYPIRYRNAIHAIETDLGARLGATVRCYMYHILFRPVHRQLLVDMATRHTSAIERILWSKLAMDDTTTTNTTTSKLLRGMRKVMGITEDSAAISLTTIRSIFEDISRQLHVVTTTPTRQKLDYLMDTESTKIGFTAADLTFCSLAAPLIAPPEAALFTLASTTTTQHTNINASNRNDGVMREGLILPRELLELRSELRNTVAGQHVLEIYRNHRLGAFRRTEQSTSDNSSAGSGGLQCVVGVGDANDGESAKIKMENHNTTKRCRVVLPKTVNRDRLPWKSDVTEAEVAAAAAGFLSGRDDAVRIALTSKL